MVTNCLHPFRHCSRLGRSKELRSERGDRHEKAVLSLICLACILNASAVATHAQTPDNSTDTTAPSYDMKAQALIDLQAVNKKCVDLAEALPADKITWRPSPDARSFAEVFLHVAGERYGFLSMLGATPPAGFKAGAI